MADIVKRLFGSLPDPSRRFTAGGCDSGDWPDQGRDRTAPRHLPPASLRYFARAQTGVRFGLNDSLWLRW